MESVSVIVRLRQSSWMFGKIQRRVLLLDEKTMRFPAIAVEISLLHSLTNSLGLKPKLMKKCTQRPDRQAEKFENRLPVPTNS